jgi:hypothetical protein
MKTLNAIFTFLMTIVGLSGCGTVIKTHHHITLDHNINVNINNFNIGLTHKYIDLNGTRATNSQSLTLGNIVSNIESIDENKTTQ